MSAEQCQRRCIRTGAVHPSLLTRSAVCDDDVTYNRFRYSVLFNLIVSLLINLNCAFKKHLFRDSVNLLNAFRSLTLVQNIRVGQILYSKSIKKFYV